MRDAAVRQGDIVTAFDANGNRTQQTEENGGAAEITRYTYDANDRLLEVSYPNQVVSYTYDAAYNRTGEKTTTGASVTVDKTYAYNTRNQLETITDNLDAAQNITYQYDANGNQVIKSKNGSITTFVYDARDQLVSVRQDATTLGMFRYDYRGMRTEKEGADGLIRYSYDGNSVLTQSDASNTTIAKYEYGPDKLLSLNHTTEGRQYYLFDALGSVSNLAKPDGTLQARYSYDAWGHYRATAGTSWNTFGFTGHEKDNETGLYYFKARFYDPDTDRFLTQDSYLGEGTTPPSLHRYLYAYANPTVYVDLNGYEACFAQGGLGCGDDRSVEEQAQYQAAREREREALLNRKSDIDPFALAKQQSQEHANEPQVIEESDSSPNTQSQDDVAAQYYRDRAAGLRSFEANAQKQTDELKEKAIEEAPFIATTAPKLREAVEARLRSPGGLHEWHLVSRAPTFKRWGISAEQIRDLRTATSDVNFVNPVGRHGGKGSTKAHNELLDIIDSALDYSTFTRRLQNWSNYRLKGGADALPKGLRP